MGPTSNNLLLELENLLYFSVLVKLPSCINFGLPKGAVMLVDQRLKEINNLGEDLGDFPGRLRTKVAGAIAVQVLRQHLTRNGVPVSGAMSSSKAQVPKIVRIARELGVNPATLDEARKILALKGFEKAGLWLKLYLRTCPDEYSI
jgi:hypothetical protein